MREKLIEAKAHLQMQMENIDKALAFFEEHPEMEMLLAAYVALTQSPTFGMFR